MKERLEYHHKFLISEHRMLKHKESFCKVVKLVDGLELVIHTNKQEGFKEENEIHVEYFCQICQRLHRGVFKLNCAAKNLIVLKLSLI